MWAARNARNLCKTLRFHCQTNDFLKKTSIVSCWLARRPWHGPRSQLPKTFRPPDGFLKSNYRHVIGELEFGPGTHLPIPRLRHHKNLRGFESGPSTTIVLNNTKKRFLKRPLADLPLEPNSRARGPACKHYRRQSCSVCHSY